MEVPLAKQNTLLSPARQLSGEDRTVRNSVVQSLVGKSVWVTMIGISVVLDLAAIVLSCAIAVFLGKSEFCPCPDR